MEVEIGVVFQVVGHEPSEKERQSDAFYYVPTIVNIFKITTYNYVNFSAI